MFDPDTDFETYLNPVFPHSFPDPFVLKFRGEYFAYCTGLWRDGKAFGILRSRDLVNWTEVGGAMLPLETNAPFYWAPEVTYSNGKFYLYYSVGNETLMELRVAISDTPDGGFVDCGVKLTLEDFAIDAHVFTNDDGQKYLFYATDFLSHTHIGTGTVVDKMLDFFTLEGNPRPVTRAKYDWQIYDANRIEKGGARWHTVEGAFVLKRKGIYYEMFSGGNWQNISYGVSFAITDEIEKPEEWTQFSDGEKVFPILRTLPDVAVGPGHNSVVRGPNNRELYCIYHRWTQSGRVLAIDRMDFAHTRIFIEGASFTPQIAPFTPTLLDYFEAKNLNRQTRGDWKFAAHEAICEFSEKSELIYQINTASFLSEFSLREIETIDETGGFGFCLQTVTETILDFAILPKTNLAVLELGETKQQTFALPNDFNAAAIHLLRVEVDASRVKILLDDSVWRFDEMLEKAATQIAFTAKNAKAAFSGFALTEGYEDLFDWKDTEIEKHGWQKSSESTVWRIEDQELVLENKSEAETFFTKGAAQTNFKFAANIRFIETFNVDWDFGFALLNGADTILQRFSLRDSVASKICRQFSFLKSGEKLIFQFEGTTLEEFIVSSEPCRIGIFSKYSTIALEMVRLTVL